MSTADERLFESTFHPSLLKPTSVEGKVWEVCMIEAGKSLNIDPQGLPVYYPADVLRENLSKFEGVKACCYYYGKEFDHLNESTAVSTPPGTFAGNVVGFFKNVRFDKFTRPDGSSGEGVVANFHLLDGNDRLRETLLDAFKQGRPDLLGFSIDARGRSTEQVIGSTRMRVVQSLRVVESTDVVSRPAAGGGILRLVASISGPEQILSLIQTHRPGWMHGFAAAEDGADLTDQCVRIIETNRLRAEDAQKLIPMDETTRLAESVRAVKALESAATQIRGDMLREAHESLRNWIAVHPANEKDPYLFPYQGTSLKESTMTDPNATPVEGASAAAPVAAAPAPATPDVAAPAPVTEPVAAPVVAPVAAAPVMAPIATPAPVAAPVAAAPAPVATAEETVLQEALKKQKDEQDQREGDLRMRESVLRFDEKLGKSGLPTPAIERLKASLVTLAQAGVVTDEEIDTAITGERGYIESFQASVAQPTNGQITGLGDAQTSTPAVSGVEAESDRWGKAWEGFFRGGMDPVENVEPITSLHQAFGEMLGHKIGYVNPEEMADIIFASVAQGLPRRPTIRVEKHLDKLRHTGLMVGGDILRETVSTGDFTVAFGDAMFKRLQAEYKSPAFNDWRMVVSSIENLKDATNPFRIVRIGGTPVLPTVGQGAPYPELADSTEVEEQIQPTKKGGLRKFTWEDALADRIGVLRRVPRDLGRSAARTVQQLVWNEIDQNLNQADGNPLIDASHNNLVATNPVLSYANITTAIRLLRNMPEQDTNEKLGLDPAFLFVGPTKEAIAHEITDSQAKVTSGEDSTVQTFVGEGGKIGMKSLATIGLGRSTSPDTQFRWYVAASPRDAETIVVGFLGGRDRPDMFVQSPVDTPTQGASFDADILTFKIRLVVGARAADSRWITGSLATA